MPNDFLYANAPLVEVIAELHWKLDPLQSIPNGAIDPHYKTFESDFKDACIKKGFASIERIVPEEIPQELLAHKVISRYRKAPDIWPLFQTGPGLLAMNIIPPYGGWDEFAPFIAEGFDLLHSCYPIPDKYLNLEKLHLRYIDAFTSEHGVNDRAEFVRNDLCMARELPDQILSHASNTKESVLQTSEATISLTKPAFSKGTVKVETGQKGKDPAVIATFVIETQNQVPQSQEDVITWFNDAHWVLHDWFDAMLSDRVKDQIGPKKEIS